MHEKVFKNAISVLQDYHYQGIPDRMIILGPRASWLLLGLY